MCRLGIRVRRNVYINLYDEGFPVTEENKKEYTTDGLHPNDVGHSYIAGKICDYIKKGRK